MFQIFYVVETFLTEFIEKYPDTRVSMESISWMNAPLPQKNTISSLVYKGQKFYKND